MSTKTELEFLRESNAIEGVYDEDSLLQAERAWKGLKEYKRMTVGAMLWAHKVLMLNHKLYPNEKGYFRRRPVYVGYREMLKPSQIEDAIKQLVLNINDAVKNGKKESEIWKEKICKLHHIQYEAIHPFIDGNGRTGRMFMNWERLRLGLPVLVIKEGDYTYYDWFREPITFNHFNEVGKTTNPVAE